MRLLSVLFLLSLGFFLSSCGGDELPTCIQEKLDAFETDSTVCESTANSIGGNLVTFTFRTETVYCFNWGTCNPNKTIEIWSEDCTLICELGGPNMETVCDGVPWADNSEEIESLYQN